MSSTQQHFEEEQTGGKKDKNKHTCLYNYEDESETMYSVCTDSETHTHAP